MYTNTRTFTAALAASFLASVSQGHMIMATPKPFGGDGLDNSPLSSGGADFPCKVKGDPATFFKRDGLETTVAVGETQTLSFKGSAVHGGGSCQLALTKDLQPTASSSWQVILSMEGGCPSKSGSGPDTYDFKIPDGIEPGQYVFAWTWISKLAGQPEYYMNCSPMTVSGGSKRSTQYNETVELFSRQTTFPELFVANIGSVNGCKTEPSTDPEFPNPGPNTIRPGTTNKFAKVAGSNCVPKGAKEVASPGGDSGSGSGSDTGSAPISSSSAVVPSQTSSQASLEQPTSFVTSVVQATTSSAVVQPTTTAVAVPTSASNQPATSSGMPSSGSVSGGLSGPCNEEGTFNCVGGSSYQQCASGSWSAMMPMPPTTKCQEGKSTTLWGRDETVPAHGNAKRSFRARRVNY